MISSPRDSRYKPLDIPNVQDCAVNDATSDSRSKLLIHLTISTKRNPYAHPV